MQITSLGMFRLDRKTQFHGREQGLVNWKKKYI